MILVIINGLAAHSETGAKAVSDYIKHNFTPTLPESTIKSGLNRNENYVFITTCRKSGNPVLISLLKLKI